MGSPVVHFEITGPDGPALRQFYTDLFGWKIDVQGEEMGSYGIVPANEGGIGGGMLPTTENMPARSYVTFYVQVDDLQAALDKVAGMGGKAIMPPMEIAPGMGSIALFGDPADNTIGLYALPPEWDGQMPPKGDGPPVVHFEVGGSDAAMLAEFYTGMFDWQIDHHEQANYRFIQQESGGIGGGIFQHMEGPPKLLALRIFMANLWPSFFGQGSVQPAKYKCVNSRRFTANQVASIFWVWILVHFWALDPERMAGELLRN